MRTGTRCPRLAFPSEIGVGESCLVLPGAQGEEQVGVFLERLQQRGAAGRRSQLFLAGSTSKTSSHFRALAGAELCDDPLGGMDLKPVHDPPSWCLGCF